MSYKRYLFPIYCILCSCKIFAEGTKELRPNTSDKGNLLLMGGYSNFGLFGATSKEQIKIRISDVGERIYFGFNNKNGKDSLGKNSDQGTFVPNIPYRIISPTGKIAFQGTIPPLGSEGNIATWDAAVNGPKELGNTSGYDALEILATESGDYILEFDPMSQNIPRLNLHLFDVTIADAQNNVLKGRLHCQGWQISTESYTNPFNGIVYPYEKDNTLYQVNFNGIQPWVFVINFNANGTSSTNDILFDRQSKIGNHTIGAHEVFLNPPDERLYPTQLRDASLDMEVAKTDCKTSEFCINFSTNTIGLLEGFLDFNNNGIYDFSTGEVPFHKQINSSGKHCIYWDGKDLNGNLLGNTSFQVFARFGVGTMHLPLYDVEHNRNGYIIKTVRPATLQDPVIFWDDTQITEGNAMDGLINLSGCNSTQGGCHKWANRGSINDNTALDKQETINTWWHSQLTIKSQILSFTSSQKVNLSFAPDRLSQKDTTVCKGENVSFYIYNDGINHYDPTRYSYSWQFNNLSFPALGREHLESINSTSQMIVKAVDLQYPTCISYDTLQIKIALTPRVSLSSIPPKCGQANGQISGHLIEGDQNTIIQWQHDPQIKTLSLQNLQRGFYSLLVSDSTLSRCRSTSTIDLTEEGGIMVDSIRFTSPSCIDLFGEAQVTMQEPSKIYEYSWDNGPFINSASQGNLSPGSHMVIIKETGTLCSAIRNFVLPTTKAPAQIKTTNEVCNQGNASIEVSPPSSIYTLWLNGILQSQNKISNLQDGRYNVQLKHPSIPQCDIDSTVFIQNIESRNVNADFEMIQIDSSMVKLSNQSVGYTSIKWIINNQFTYLEQTQLTLALDLNQSNQITIIAIDKEGCLDTLTKVFSLTRQDEGDCGIALPNVFTPNDDNSNDDIGILGYAPKVELIIFDRWGEVIFRSQQISHRWDGTYRNEPANVGVYPFILTWECPNKYGKMIKHQKVGDITLLR